MFVFVTKRFLVRSFFFSLPNMIRRAEKPDLYATRATLEYLQLIIHQGPKFNLKLRKNIILICIINMLDINGKFFSKLGGLGCTL